MENDYFNVNNNMCIYNMFSYITTVIIILRGDKMNINDFINSLSNELIKNNFHYIEISKDFNRYDNSYLIYIINYKDNKKYCHGFSIHEKCLNCECINDIVNRLLSQ